ILTFAALLEIPSNEKRFTTRTPFAICEGWRPTLRRQYVTSSVSPDGPAQGQLEDRTEPPDASALPSTPPADAPGTAVLAAAAAPRWLVIVAWSVGPAALYALASLGHAAFVERILSVDVGF